VSRRFTTGIAPTDRTRGFSLVELLIALFVIAALMALLMPALPRMRDAAQRAACGANLGDIGKAVELFRADHRETFPKARYMPPPWLSGDPDPPFNTAMAAYLPVNAGSYVCPGDRVVHNRTYTAADGSTATTGMSYTYIVALSGVTFEQSFYSRFLRWTVTETPVLHDFDGGVFETQDGQQVKVDFFHEQRNALFVDGHVGQPAARSRR